MKIKLLAIALTAAFFTSAQQGRNFSMWYQNNMQLNPAAVATNYNDMQLFANFRYQYFTVSPKPFQTMSASIEGKLFRSNTRNGYLGIGASFINDMSGDGRYTVNEFSVPIAYHLFLDENNFISLGISPGFYQRSVSGSNLTWNNQWTGYEFNTTISPEIIPNATTSNLDLGAGLFYTYKASNTQEIFGGFSVKHIVQPEITFNYDEDLFRRYVGQLGAHYKFDNNFFGISPQILAMFQGPNQNIVFGTNFDFYLQEPSLRTVFFTPTIFSFGVYHRIRDAINVNASITFKGITIAASYDSNINSMLPTSKSVGAVEMAIKYDISLNRKKRFIY